MSVFSRLPLSLYTHTLTPAAFTYSLENNYYYYYDALGTRVGCGYILSILWFNKIINIVLGVVASREKFNILKLFNAYNHTTNIKDRVIKLIIFKVFQRFYFIIAVGEMQF